MMPIAPQYGPARTVLVLILIASLPLLTFAAAEATKKVQAVEVEEPPRIDGRIDDPCWGAITPLDGFIQFDPVNGGPASERTEVWVAYDRKNLYFAFKMHDTRPKQIWAELTPRNGWEETNDSITVILDTYNDKRTSFEFMVNPRGVQKNTVDTIWKSGAVITTDGWTAEMAIPFKSLRFSSDRQQLWGILFERYIHRLHETDTWTPRSRDQAELQQSAELSGIENVKPGYNLEFFPYIGLRTSHWEAEKDTAFAYGLDFKYGILPNLILDLTASPDFSEVESDPFIYQLSPYENYLGENRPFFNEGSQYFQSGRIDENPMFHFYNGSTQLFYSRRISDPRFAGKLSGKSGGFSFGFLGAWNEQTDGPVQFFTVGRLKKDLFQNSQVGLYYAGFEARDDYNRNFGLDYNFNFGQIYYIDGMSAISSNPGAGNRDNWLHTFTAKRQPDTGWSWDFEFQRVEKNVNVRTGFISRIDFQKIDIKSGYAWRFNRGAMKRWNVNGGLEIQNDTDWAAVGQELTLNTTIQFRNNSSFNIFLNGGEKKHQILDETGKLFWNDRLIGTYGMELRLNSSRGGFWKGWELGFGLDKKGIYNDEFTRVEPGNEINMNAGLTIRPLSFLELSGKTGWTRQTVAQTGERWFDGATYQLGLHYQITRELFLNTRLLGETDTHQYSFDFLAGYYFGAGNIAQLTVKKSSRRFDLVQESGYSVTLKVSYLLRM